jgi:hypothetical protein
MHEAARRARRKTTRYYLRRAAGRDQRPLRQDTYFELHFEVRVFREQARCKVETALTAALAGSRELSAPRG